MENETEIPRVSPENFWREVWHDNCPNARPGTSPMKHLNEYLDVPDEADARLRLFECVVCHQRVYAGLHPVKRTILHRAAEVA